MVREVPYDVHARCNSCGKKGAFDFTGDFLCEECLLESEDE